jgi:hypothetical protein
MKVKELVEALEAIEKKLPGLEVVYDDEYGYSPIITVIIDTNYDDKTIIALK